MRLKTLTSAHPVATRARRLLKDERGAAAIEFALIAPALMLLMIGIADYGLAIYTDMQVQNAAQAGAEYAAVHGYDQTSVASAVTSTGGLVGIAASPAPSQYCGCPSATGVTSSACGGACSDGSSPGTYVSASASSTYTTLLPYPGIPASFNFASTSTVRTQ